MEIQQTVNVMQVICKIENHETGNQQAAEPGKNQKMKPEILLDKFCNNR